jgi:hypothetical protein
MYLPHYLYAKAYQVIVVAVYCDYCILMANGNQSFLTASIVHCPSGGLVNRCFVDRFSLKSDCTVWGKLGPLEENALYFHSHRKMIHRGDECRPAAPATELRNLLANPEFLRQCFLLFYSVNKWVFDPFVHINNWQWVDEKLSHTSGHRWIQKW